MTREEARNIVANADLSKVPDDVIEAFFCLGISNGKENCNDYISRQAVKELFQEACEMEMYDFLGIDDIPSVTPQSNTGHWIDVAGGCECSECGCLEVGYSNFCPDCGAKMEVEE